MTARDWDKPTWVSASGEVVTRGTTPIKWARIASRGAVHRIEGVIIRWNFMGGTRERPDVTFLTTCGPQRHQIQPAPNHDPWDRCARCEARIARMPDA